MSNADDILDRYARTEQARPIRIPAGFADRVTARLAAEQRSSQRRRRLIGFSGLIAASLLLFFVLWSPPRQQPIAQVTQPPSPRPSLSTKAKPNLTEEWNRAGAAIASLTKKTSEQTITPTPTQTLLSSAEAVTMPKPVETPLIPDVTFLSGKTFEPVTGQPRRAVKLFLRDFGITPR